MEQPIKKKVFFLISHPIQYFTPLFKAMASVEEWDFEVLYCSDENLKGHLDKGFGVQVKWDIPLLDEYKYRFLPNKSKQPSIFNGFRGLYNPEIFAVLKANPGSTIIIHGWAYLTHFLTLISAFRYKVKVFLRSENPYIHELNLPLKKKLAKKAILGFLYKFPSKFLFIGNQNKAFYQHYGAPEKDLIYTPYCVDNDRFQASYKELGPQREALKRELGIAEGKKVILYSGKYIAKKRPVDLLKAMYMLNDDNLFAIFLGEGELRPEMENYIKANGLNNVLLTGFINQSELAKYYVGADLFVICSGIGETWGLVVNEAMNFNLPVISSDLVGSAHNLINEGDNGYVYPMGNVEMVASRIKDVLIENKLSMTTSPQEIIKEYSYYTIVSNLKKAIN